jgi:gas vesicle protein
MEEFIFKDGGIYINPKNKGKFTKKAKAAGMGVQEFARHVLANKDDYPTSTVKQANFARNAKGWKKKKAFPGATIAMALPGVIQGIQNIREQKQQEKSAKESADVSKLFSHLRDPRFTPEKDIAMQLMSTDYDQGTTYVAEKGASVLGNIWQGLDKANKTLGEYGFTTERALGFANQVGGGYAQTLGSIFTGIGGPIGGAIGTVAGLLFDSGHKKRMKRYEDEYNQNAWYLTQSAPLYAKKGAVVAEKGNVSIGDIERISENGYRVEGELHKNGGTELNLNGKIIEAELGEIGFHTQGNKKLFGGKEMKEPSITIFGNMLVPGTDKPYKEFAEKFLLQAGNLEKRIGKIPKYYPGSAPNTASENTKKILEGERNKEYEKLNLLAALQTDQLREENPRNIIVPEKIASNGTEVYLDDKKDKVRGLDRDLVYEKTASAPELNFNQLVSMDKLLKRAEKKLKATPYQTNKNTRNSDLTKKFIGDALNVASSLFPLLRNPRYRTPRVPYELIGQIRPEMVPMPEDPRLMPITPVSGNELELVRAIGAATQDNRGTTPFAEQKIREAIDYRNNLYAQAVQAQAENVGRYNAMASQTQSIAANINAANARTKVDAQTARINMMLDFVKAEQMAQRDRNTLRMAAQAFPNYYFGPDGGLRFVPNFGAIADMFNTKSDSRETQDS